MNALSAPVNISQRSTDLSNATRERLRAVVNETHPRLNLHGHHHGRTTSTIKLDDEWVVEVVGLHRDWTVDQLVTVGREMDAMDDLFLLDLPEFAQQGGYCG